MTRAFLALGSNLGDRAFELRRAVEALDEVTAISAVYETDPVGGPDGQGPYLNMVVELDTDRTPRQLLATCQALERTAHRRREARWGPRTLDADLLWVDGTNVHESDLEVPHPRMYERPFVLAPLAELAPDLVPADWENDFDHLGISRVGPLDELVT
jgi:2-amino-4-hydroxy-6-hydroxymethyldihydropteridine diphosphokinase